MEQRRRVQRLITQTGYNPRRGTTRRTRVVPVSSNTIDQVMTTARPLIVDEQPDTPESIEQLVDSVERLIIDTDDVEVDVEEMDTEALRNRRAAIRKQVDTALRERMYLGREFYPKFFNGIPDITLGELGFAYSMYLQLPDQDIVNFMQDLRDIIEGIVPSSTLSIYGEDIVLIHPTIATIVGVDTLEIIGTSIEELPVDIADMSDITTVVLSNNNRLRRIPDEVEQLVVYQD